MRHTSRHANNPPLHRLVLGNAAGGKRPGPVTLEGRDARSHLRVLGASGSGKSKFLASLVLQNINAGVGAALLDPHGDLCDDVLSALIEWRFFADARAYERLWYLDFSRADCFIAWNVLDQPYEIHTIARNLLESWKRAWSGLA
ncbi:MAG TPA: DUF87 domain-containing protein, partial [Ktedonobacterales bacterium]